jgi:LysM repeat protein
MSLISGAKDCCKPTPPFTIMARFQIKLLIFLLTMGFAVGCAAVAIWIYEHQIKMPKTISQEIKQKKSKERQPPDPGLKRFDAAADLIRLGRLDDGKEALIHLLKQFPNSGACPEAKRIIGEINMDALFSRELKGGKKEYTVQPGDVLDKITRKTGTTFEALARVNALTSNQLQLGDKLFIIPMEFELKVLSAAKKLWLMRQGTFFKEYTLADIQLPPNIKIPSSREGVEMEVGSKSAVMESKIISATHADFLRAEKRIILQRKGSSGIPLLLRTPQVAKPQPVSPPMPAPDAKGKKTKKESSFDLEDPPIIQVGIFLNHEDIEEVYPLLKSGSKVNLVQ